MNFARTLTVSILLCAALSGCASMSAEECAASDWKAVGFEDGARGYTSDRFAQHRKDCAEHGITADFDAYQAGRSQGLQEFCQPGRGFSHGVSGGQYSGVCPQELEAGFVDAYNAGYKLYGLRANVNGTNSAIYARQSELKNTEDRIVDIGVALIDDETTRDERIQLLAELKKLSERSGELESEIESLVAERARAEQELESYQQTLTAYGY
jgi:Protein of unknown function (DUF2799)